MIIFIAHKNVHHYKDRTMGNLNSCRSIKHWAPTVYQPSADVWHLHKFKWGDREVPEEKGLELRRNWKKWGGALDSSSWRPTGLFLCRSCSVHLVQQRPLSELGEPGWETRQVGCVHKASSALLTTSEEPENPQFEPSLAKRYKCVLLKAEG